MRFFASALAFVGLIVAEHISSDLGKITSLQREYVRRVYFFIKTEHLWIKVCKFEGLQWGELSQKRQVFYDFELF